MSGSWSALAWATWVGCGGPLRFPIDDSPPPETGTVPAYGHTATTDPGTAVDGLLSALAARDVTADEGAISWSALDDCCVWGNCLLINEGSDYGTWALPPSPGEYVADRAPDPATGLVESWRLAVDQGTLYVGPRPPGAAYVSFRTYLHDRDDGAGGRVGLFDNLGDTLNQQAWEVNEDGTLLVLTTANAVLAERVTAAASAAGWPAVNLDVIPASYVRPGLGREADTYHMTLRVVGFEDRAAFEAWRQDEPGRVFKLRPDRPLPATALPVPEIRPAVASPPPDTAAPVAALRQALVDAHPGWSVVDAVVNPLEPPLAPAPGEEFCWAGCNRDVSYSTTGDVPLLAGDRIVIYGVDPLRLGRATWTEVMLAGRSEDDAAGHAGSDDLLGSAAAWDPTAPESLYAYTFARDCAGVPFCQEVPYTCPGMAPLELGAVLWRHYLDPATDTWPPLAGLGERGALHLRPPRP